ncbi:MAG: helix-turn-helix domain-containing protein [Anaerolineales bacterium]|nr:helix-turn-helix domain-containing protein [Anaerolineales bacterium]
MIIKNIAQLKSSEARRETVCKELEEYSGYTGIQYEFYVRPLIIEMQELDRQINEFKELTHLPFEQAIIDVLSKPVLVDNISELLAKLRIAAKKTQAEMAELLGWEQSNLSRFENETYSSQTISKIVEFASALKIYLQVMPSLTEEPEQPQTQLKIERINLEETTSTPIKSFLIIEKSDIDTYRVSVDSSTDV